MCILAAEVYKAIVLGPPNVGKSSLIRRHQVGEFSETYTATIGVDMKVTTFNFPDASVVLTVVDIGGQETFSGLRSRFFAGAHHVILVFDKTDRSTFDVIPEWHESLTRNVNIPDHLFPRGSLVGNKADLEDRIQVTTEEAKRLADILTLEYFDASAKTGLNVAEIFMHAASESRQLDKSLSQT
ncbi:MAG: Rab family GTPase [Candidatus Hermodarchaeota archaeon]